MMPETISHEDLIEHRGMTLGLKVLPNGFVEVHLGNGHKLPGVFTSKALASDEAMRYINKRQDELDTKRVKAKTKPVKKETIDREE